MSIRLEHKATSHRGEEWLPVELTTWKFPAGELGVKITGNPETNIFKIVISFEGSDDLINMILLVNAVRNYAPEAKLALRCDYFPYARQDRVMTHGESHSLQAIAELIKAQNFEFVEVVDPHSDVLQALFPPGMLKIKQQYITVINTVLALGSLANTALVSPDAGALKKIYKLAQIVELPVVECGKVRDVTTGKIVGSSIPQGLSFDKLIIVDDICDGGATFIELAKGFKAGGYTGKLILIVSHGIFSKGVDCLYEYFDEVYAVNNLRKPKNV